ncbi:hypothetical protein JAAARDRAFT_548671 [Jaapia argillacea MUCL 33604]|uniref:MYND-type domain-containing protein n=1 Tax=Jaapia argillacea MUCL 33604 TaxID=933084 RepID=A0A067PK58_9AGAM|nr:hypothetical protein JAAARDRAFT_548671 [Jaapia argillacea MUCL 33604]
MLDILAKPGYLRDIEDSGLSLRVLYTNRLLLQNGANPNHRDRYGSVPIHVAFQANQVECAELLMEYGANLEIPDADGYRPSQAYLGAGPQIIATVRKWIKKRTGEKAPVDEKKCDCCRVSAGENVKLRMCGSCHTARYCSVECQRKETSHFFGREGRTSPCCVAPYV